MTVGLHLCRGNFRNSVHFSEGGYDAIATKLFNEINVDVYYLEYDTEVYYRPTQTSTLRLHGHTDLPIARGNL